MPDSRSHRLHHHYDPFHPFHPLSTLGPEATRGHEEELGKHEADALDKTAPSSRSCFLRDVLNQGVDAFFVATAVGEGGEYPHRSSDMKRRLDEMMP